MVGQVVAVASGKGGVGKTTTVLNLGVVLRRAEHSVALVDADLGMANLGSMLGIAGELTLHDVLSGGATLEEALVEEAPGFAVLSGSETLTDYPDADPRNLGDVLETLAESYDFVLVDTGAGMSHDDVLPLGLADLVLLVSSPDPAAIGDTRKTAELAGLAEGEVAGVVVTKADANTDASAVADRIGVDLLGVIPYDGTVRQSTASGRPLEAVDPETPAAAAYRELASGLADGAPDPLRDAPGGEAAAAGSTTDPADEPETGGPTEPDETREPAPDQGAGTDAEPTGASDGPKGAAVETEAEASSGADDVESAEEGRADELEGGEEAHGTEADPEDSGDADPEPSAAGDGPAEESPSEVPGTNDHVDAEDASPVEGEPAEEDEPTDHSAAVDGPEPIVTEAEPAEADDGTAGAADGEEGTEEVEEGEEEDPLAEFEDDESASTGGLLARIGRLFR